MIIVLRQDFETTPRVEIAADMNGASAICRNTIEMYILAKDHSGAKPRVSIYSDVGISALTSCKESE